MRKGFRRKAGAQDGFTLIELLITFVILSILVSMVIMTMMVSQNRAQRAACKSNLRIITDAITQYRSIHDGEIPPDLETLVEDPIPYIKPSFSWICPSGDLEGVPGSGDYRKYYNSSTGETSCPRADHNP
jgi:prepilin-type N-terminal cleavage/methylation domain-containing protein